MSTETIHRDSVYTILSTKDFLGIPETDPDSFSDSVCSYFGDNQLLYGPAPCSVAEYTASPAMVEKFSSDKPFAASLLLAGHFVGNHSFAELLQNLAQETVAIPSRIQDCSTEVFTISSTCSIHAKALSNSEFLRFSSNRRELALEDRPIIRWKGLVIDSSYLQGSSIFRIPQLRQLTAITAEVAEQLKPLRAALGIELERVGKLL